MFLVSGYQVVFQITGVKQLQEVLKILIVLSPSGSSSVSRDPEMCLRTTKMIRGVGCCQLLEIPIICES